MATQRQRHTHTHMEHIPTHTCKNTHTHTQEAPVFVGLSITSTLVSDSPPVNDLIISLNHPSTISFLWQITALHIEIAGSAF